jgi:hypothetical protein
MYSMYPDWGPARHRQGDDDATVLQSPQSLQSVQSVQSGLDLRDNGGQRPDDN